MTAKILLTSFETWLTHQKSNASDDLLELVSQIESLPYSLNLLRKLPVDFELAPNLAIAQIAQFQPDAIICCGMAESRLNLNLESCARRDLDLLKTPVNLEVLATKLTVTEISHDAGKFVCEALYYSVLKHLSDFQIEAQCVFVHVPILTADNTGDILADFLSVIHHLAANKKRIFRERGC